MPQESRLVNQDQGFSTARRSLDDMVPRTAVPGDGFLVVVEDLDPLRRVDIGASVPFGRSMRTTGNRSSFRWSYSVPASLKWNLGGNISTRAFRKQSPVDIIANVRSKVQIIPEKDLVGADRFVQPSSLVFVLVDIRKHYPAVDGNFGLAIISRVLREQSSVGLESVQQGLEIFPRLS